MQTKLHQRLDQGADELELWKCPRADVRDRLLAHDLPYAQALPSKRAAKQQFVDPDEYGQQAMTGLWHAIDSEVPAQGTTFTTYAKTRFGCYLFEAQRSNDRVQSKVRSAHRNGESDVRTIGASRFMLRALSEAAGLEYDTAQDWVCNEGYVTATHTQPDGVRRMFDKMDVFVIGVLARLKRRFGVKYTRDVAANVVRAITENAGVNPEEE